jgi:sarcosine oxidase subunit gamma
MPSLLAPHLKAGRFGASGASPLTITERRLAVAQVMSRKGQAGATSNAIERILGMRLPDSGQSSINAGTTAIWIAPETWLLMRDASGGGSFIQDLVKACGSSASVVDQTCGKSILRLSGSNAREVLAKGCRIDLHPSAFAPGNTSVTPIAHIQAVLMQIDAIPTFDLIVPSTLAQDFAEWLCLSAAQFGYEIK